MSKYEKSLNYGDNVPSPVMPNEKVIWEGKPKKSAFIFNKAIGMAPFAIIWLLFDSTFIFMMFSARVWDENPQIAYFAIPFFLIHLAPVWIWLSNILTANRKWKNTKYYITDKRIIIQNGFIAENYQTIYYKDIKNVRLHIGVIDKILGVGDVHFDFGYLRASNSVASFLDIEDYNEIYQRAQKVVLDIQTDIEYPNALRPENNPGYNTKYNPIDGE